MTTSFALSAPRAQKTLILVGPQLRSRFHPGSPPKPNVLDLFGGSGSTLIAADQTGRKSFLMELDPLYCDVIVERFEKFTGKKAERLAEATT